MTYSRRNLNDCIVIFYQIILILSSFSSTVFNHTMSRYIIYSHIKLTDWIFWLFDGTGLRILIYTDSAFIPLFSARNFSFSIIVNYWNQNSLKCFFIFFPTNFLLPFLYIFHLQFLFSICDLYFHFYSLFFILIFSLICSFTFSINYCEIILIWM